MLLVVVLGAVRSPFSVLYLYGVPVQYQFRWLDLHVNGCAPSPRTMQHLQNINTRELLYSLSS